MVNLSQVNSQAPSFNAIRFTVQTISSLL